MAQRSGYPRQLLARLILAGLLSLISAFASAQVGQPWTWGDNTYGELGNGTTTDSNVPVQPSGISGITQISAGEGCCLALKSDGTVWAWGDNTYGELGNGTNTSTNTPVQVSGLTGMVQVSEGAFHSLALKSDGTVWAWGYNYWGQLGNNTTNDSNVAVQVLNLTNVVQVSAGAGGHSIALKSDGTVWAWGDNYWGEVGDGTNIQRHVPFQSLGLTGIVQIAAATGGQQSLALKSDGTVWAWGRGDLGQLGIGTNININLPTQILALSGVIAVSAGGRYSMALISDGTVWAWGRNGSGELGNGTYNSTNTPVHVSNLTGVTQISGGAYHSLAIKSDGTVWAWGDNIYDELGDGTNTLSNVPIQVSNLTNQTNISAGISFSVSLQALVATGLGTTLTAGNISKTYGVTFKVAATLLGTNSKAIEGKKVFFSIDGNNIGGGLTNSTGVATLAVSNPTQYGVGQHTLTAIFNGDATYESSAATATVTITLATTNISFANYTVAPGETKSFVATLKRTYDSAPIAGETVWFRIGFTFIGSAVTNSAGQASYSYTGDETMSLGGYNLFAEFDSDPNYYAYLAESTLTIAQATSKLNLSSVTGKPGTTISLKAALTRATDKSPLANETVAFQIDGVAVGTATTNSAGLATLPYSVTESLSVGAHVITATFAGDTYDAATTNTTTLTIAQAPTKTAASNISGSAGTSVVLKATLTRTTDNAPLAGRTLVFLIDGVTVGTDVASSAGTAFNYYVIPAGTASGKHTITVQYAGESLYVASSGTATLTVK